VTCADCRAPVPMERRNHLYADCGLPNVTLLSIPVGHCACCGRQYVTIPRIAKLHRTIVASVVRKPGPLTAAEVMFLRKSLGWSNADFAAHVGVREETASRWQHGEEISPAADRLLRLCVAELEPVEDYTVHELRTIGRDAAPLRLRLRECDRQGWCVAKA
jgi:putative zinc finger/helix-turn-helix YgiT family protein